MEDLYDQRVKEVNELREKWRTIQENQQNAEYHKTVALSKHLTENLERINKFLIEFNASSDQLLNNQAEKKVLFMQDSSSAQELIELIRIVFAMFKQVSEKNTSFASPVLTKETLVEIERNLVFIQKFYEEVSDDSRMVKTLNKLIKEKLPSTNSVSAFSPESRGQSGNSTEREGDSTCLTIASDDVFASSPY